MAYTAVIAAVATSYSIYSGEESKKEQKTALRRQEKAQNEARAAAISQRRQAEEEVRRTNRRQPDISRILEGARASGKAGTQSTLLSGDMGRPGTTRLLGE